MNERGEGSKSLLWIVLVAIVLLLILWATGILDFSSDGELKAPDVEVSAEGGELPDIDADVADISTGTETVEVPTLEVEGADAAAEDDDGNN